MKKQSLSFFAILAIIFAGSSAFTTTYKKASTLTNEWYILKPDQCIHLGNYPASVNNIDLYWESDISGAGFAERFTEVQAAISCESEGDFVCAIQLDGADSNCDDELDSTELNAFFAGNEHPMGIVFRSE